MCDDLNQVLTLELETPSSRPPKLTPPRRSLLSAFLAVGRTHFSSACSLRLSRFFLHGLLGCVRKGGLGGRRYAHCVTTSEEGLRRRRAWRPPSPQVNIFASCVTQLHDFCSWHEQWKFGTVAFAGGFKFRQKYICELCAGPQL